MLYSVIQHCPLLRVQPYSDYSFEELRLYAPLNEGLVAMETHLKTVRLHISTCASGHCSVVQLLPFFVTPLSSCHSCHCHHVTVVTVSCHHCYCYVVIIVVMSFSSESCTLLAVTIPVPFLLTLLSCHSIIDVHLPSIHPGSPHQWVCR